MLVNNDEAAKRLASPMNLINQLRASHGNNGNGNKKNNAMSLFGIGRKKEETLIEEVQVTFNPFSTKEESQTSLLPQLSSQALPVKILPQVLPQSERPERLDNILENHESQIKLGLAHDRALDLLNRSVEALSLKLEDVKADRLPSVISAASKTVESIRKERSESAKNGKDREVHFHFYTPTQKSISEFEVIDVP